MKLVNVTNSHSRLVLNQLENTDASLFSYETNYLLPFLFLEAPEHNEILLINDKRKI
ncbi:hypothetical protein EfmJHP10_09300 [Enterococcus faecium]|nr:hypothetical protein EfmJHP10_09300 [Enterococcus faecium]